MGSKIYDMDHLPETVMVFTTQFSLVDSYLIQWILKGNYIITHQMPTFDRSNKQDELLLLDIVSHFDYNVYIFRLSAKETTICK